MIQLGKKFFNLHLANNWNKKIKIVGTIENCKDNAKIVFHSVLMSEIHSFGKDFVTATFLQKKSLKK